MNLRDLFVAGIELGDEERCAFVAQVRERDAALADQLVELLGVATDGIGDFLAEPVVAGACRPDAISGLQDAPPAAPEAPAIDGYEDFALIGQGGIGAVYRATQRAPIRREVAVKVIRTGMDSRAVLRRFEAERLALARMAHPYIATVHDAGTDDHGRPFLVMEYVDGPPITTFCLRRKLTLEQRIELGAKVCDAVDHAHRRGVLHRDLKPSNVLVVDVDDTATPKVIDFGIAKAIDGDLVDRTLVTEQGAFLGTLEYMSPEQVDGDVHAIDTRTDVYALGALLYELFTGAVPFDSARLRGLSLTRIAAVLRHELPPKPSARRQQLLAEGSRAFAVSGGALDEDLDWIVMKALEKEPDQRYGTPRQLAEDLRRYLQRLPVHAGPPSGFYRVRRYVRRYRLQVTAAAMVLLSLVVGLAGTLWYLLESRENAQLANERAASAMAAERRAMGSRIAAQAALVGEEDCDLALQLALEARRYTDDYAIAQAVLDALPHHDLLASMRLRDHPAVGVCFLPDGRLLVHADDLVAWLVDLPEQRVLRRFDGHTALITDLELAPDGGRFATASRDGEARIWDIDSGACLATLEHGTWLLRVEWSADGAWFATLARDGELRLYDGETFALREAREAREERAGFAFDPHRPRVLLYDRVGSGEVLDLERLEVVANTPPLDEAGTVKNAQTRYTPIVDRLVRVMLPRGGVSRVQVVTPDGRVLADHAAATLLRGPVTDPLVVLSGDRVLYVDLETGATARATPIEPVDVLLARSPDRKLFVAIDAQEDLVLFDAETGARLRRLAGRSDKKWQDMQVAFHPDGRRFAGTGACLRLWDLRAEYAPLDMQLERLDTDRDLVTAGAFAGPTPLALVRRSRDGARRWELWDLDRGRVVNTVAPPGIDRLQLSLDGSRLLGTAALPTGDDRRQRTRFAVFDRDGRLLRERVLPGTPRWSLFGPHGETVAVVSPPGAAPRRVEVVDVATGDTRVAFDITGPVFHWNWATGHPYGAVPFGDDTRTDFYDLATGAMVRSIRGPEGASQWYEAVDPATRRALVLLGDLRVRSYDLDRDPPAHSGEYTRLVRADTYRCGFVPNSELAWARSANEVHVFHRVTCRPFCVIRLGERVECVGARPDGSELLTVSEDGVFQRWPLRPAAAARARVVGRLGRREMELFDIGTAAEREDRERLVLQQQPTPRRQARLGELALRDGDLDEAIRCYRAGCDMGLLDRLDRHLYVRMLELLCRRMADGADEAGRAADEEAAAEALAHCLRCGVPRSRLAAIDGFDALCRVPKVRDLLGL